jgi:hypothetical protein
VDGLGQEAKGAAAAQGHYRSEVPLVGAQQIDRAVLPGEHDHRRISQADPQVAVSPDQRSGLAEIVLAERDQRVGPGVHIVQQVARGAHAQPSVHDVVQFGEDEGRQDEGSGIRLDDVQQLVNPL